MVCRDWKVISILLLTFLSISCISKSGGAQSVNCKIEARICSGDLAFRRGRGVVSDVVVSADHCGNYSHVGIVVERDHKLYVIHEVPYEGRKQAEDKIYCQSLDLFFAEDRAKTGAIYRAGIDTTERLKIAEYLDRQLTLETPFDHDYNLDDSTKLYCTELVWRAYNSIGIDLSGGRRTTINLPGFGNEMILPADIESCDKLELIYRF